MASFSFAVLTDLRRTPTLRIAAGRDFCKPFYLSDGTEAKIWVQGPGHDDGPHVMRVVDTEQRLLGEATIVPGTCQVFRTLGLLVHFAILPKA